MPPKTKGDGVSTRRSADKCLPPPSPALSRQREVTAAQKRAAAEAAAEDEKDEIIARERAACLITLLSFAYHRRAAPRVRGGEQKTEYFWASHSGTLPSSWGILVSIPFPSSAYPGGRLPDHLAPPDLSSAFIVLLFVYSSPFVDDGTPRRSPAAHPSTRSRSVEAA